MSVKFKVNCSVAMSFGCDWACTEEIMQLLNEMVMIVAMMLSSPSWFEFRQRYISVGESPPSSSGVALSAYRYKTGRNHVEILNNRHIVNVWSPDVPRLVTDVSRHLL
jgi:hypothetical protein